MPYANPIFDPGQAPTGINKTGSVIPGGTLVTVSGAKVDGEPIPIKPCAANEYPIGVTAQDVAANGGISALYGNGFVCNLLAGTGDIAVGPVENMAGGAAKTLSSGKKCGVAFTAAAAGAYALVQIQF